MKKWTPELIGPREWAHMGLIFPSTRSFRQISFLRSLYKLVAKALMVRLVRVMENLISFEHLAFVRRGQIVDRVVALEEIVYLSRRSKRECFVFKFDF